jgi:hypothetical protein
MFAKPSMPSSTARARGADTRQSEAAENRQQEHRQDLAFGERAEERSRDDVKHELGEAARRDLAGVLPRHGGVEVLRVDVHTSAGLEKEDCSQAGQQREDCQRVEQTHRLQQRLADLLRVVQRGDAADDRAEDDRSDHHLHQLHESVAQWLERGAGVGPPVAQRNAEHQPDQDLDIEKLEQLGGFHGCLLKKSACSSRTDLCRPFRRRGRRQRSVASTRSTITPDWPR